MKVENSKVMAISMERLPLQTIIDRKQLENVEYFKCLGTIITNNARCTREIKSKISVEKPEFNRKKTFHYKLSFNLKKKHVKC
jgi:hypothetical protein